MNFHTCNRHFLTWWKKPQGITYVVVNDGKSKLKGHGFWSLYKGHQLYWSFHLPIVPKKLTYAMNMDWERTSSLKNNDNFKTWKYIVMFLLKVVITFLRPTKTKPLKYHNCTILMQNCLHVAKKVLPTLPHSLSAKDFWHQRFDMRILSM